MLSRGFRGRGSWHLSHRWVELPGRRGRLIASPEGAGSVALVVPGVYCTRCGCYWPGGGCTPRWAGSRAACTTPVSAPRASCSSRPEEVRGRGPSASCDARASRCPSSRHGRIRSRCAWRTSLEFCGSYSACGGSAAFMSAHGHLPPARRPCPCLRSHDPKGLRNEGTRHGEARSRPDGCRLPEHGA